MRLFRQIVVLQICLLLLMLFTTMKVQADEPFLGEVRWFAGNFAPRGWAFCEGQLLPIAQNQSLFSLLGTMYGGDGRTTFALPDLRGRAMVHAGNGPGLTDRQQGEIGGTETETLTAAQMPAHTHTLKGNMVHGDSVMPDDRVVSRSGRIRAYAASADTDMGASSLTSIGGGQSHNNVQPGIALRCIIATIGLFPSRS